MGAHTNKGKNILLFQRINTWNIIKYFITDYLNI